MKTNNKKLQLGLDKVNHFVNTKSHEVSGWNTHTKLIDVAVNCRVKKRC